MWLLTVHRKHSESSEEPLKLLTVCSQATISEIYQCFLPAQLLSDISLTNLCFYFVQSYNVCVISVGSEVLLICPKFTYCANRELLVKVLAFCRELC